MMQEGRHCRRLIVGQTCEDVVLGCFCRDLTASGAACSGGILTSINRSSTFMSTAAFAEAAWKHSMLNSMGAGSTARTA